MLVAEYNHAKVIISFRTKNFRNERIGESVEMCTANEIKLIVLCETEMAMIC